MKNTTQDDTTPVSYPPETILTAAEVGRWLRVSERTVLDMPLPRLKLGRLVRYSAGQVLAWLEGRAESERTHRKAS